MEGNEQENDSLFNDSYWLNICAARSIQDAVNFNHFSTGVEYSIRGFLVSYQLFIFLGGTSLNSYVLSVIQHFRRLHTLEFVVALQIVIIDLVLSFIAPPAILTHVIADNWLIGTSGCAIYGFLLFSAAFLRTLMLFLFVMDRFCVVFLPFWYPKHRKKILIIFSTISWVLPTVCSTLALPFAFDCFSFLPFTRICSISPSCGFTCSVYINTLLAVFFLPAMIIPLILYSILYRKARMITASNASDSVNGNNQLSEWRATITFFLMFLVLASVTIPHLLIHVVHNKIGDVFSPGVSSFIRNASGCAISLLLILDPIIIMRNQDMREVLPNPKRFLIWCICKCICRRPQNE